MKKPRLGTIILILWGLILSGAVTIYLMYLQPARLGKTVSGALQSSLGIPTSIRQVDFYFFPNPAVRIYGLRFEYAGDGALEFRADSCSAQLSWLSLVRLKPVLHTLDLQGPVVDALLPLRPAEGKPLPGEAPVRPARLAVPKNMPALPSSLTGIRIRVNNGIFRLRQTGSNLHVLLNGISGSARLPGLISGSLDLAVSKAQLRIAKAPQFSLDNFGLKATSINEDRDGDINGILSVSALVQMASLEEALGRPVKPAYQYFPLPRPASLNASLDFRLSPATGEALFSGKAGADLVLPMNGHDTPVSVLLPFAFSDPDSIRINGMSLALYNDKATIDGTLTGLASRAPLFTGQAKVQHFSLTHWFGFSRKMTGGLQLALDHISGLLDFQLTAKGVAASRLEARVGDITLVGSGSCEDFRKPNIIIDGDVEYADLNPLFPEINGIKTPKPDLPPPAVPLNENNEHDPARVGFQIRLRAARADIHKLRAGKVDCLISPLNDPYGPETLASGKPVYGKTGARLSVSVGDLYGGTANALARLEAPYDIHAELQGVSLEEPITSLAGFSAMGGTLRAVGDVSFAGSSPAGMISSLAGTVSATLADGFFGTRTGRRTPYSSMLVTAQGKAEPGSIPLEYDLPPVMDFRGKWDVDLTMPSLRTRLISQALITFDMKNGLPERMQPQAADITLTLNKAGLGMRRWPRDVELALKGRLGFDLGQATVTVADISGGRRGLARGGTLRAEDIFADMLVQGPVSATTGVLREIAPMFGLALPPTAKAEALNALRFQGDLAYTRNSLNFKNISATLDETPVNGGMSFTLGARPFWKADLLLGAVNGDDYWPRNDGGPSSPVPTGALLGYDADLRFTVRRFSLFSSPVDNLHLPITLAKGQLSSGVVNASFPGGGSLSGTYQGKATAPATDGRGNPSAAGELDNRLQLRLTNVNMMELTRARGQSSLIAGTGVFQVDAQARLKYWNDLPRAIDGNWSVEILSGYIASATGEEAVRLNAAASLNGGERGQASVTPIMGGGTAGSSSSPQSSARTPFQRLSSSGNILAGVLHSNDFLLRSPALTVKGGGSIDLNSKLIDAAATATFLGVPEIPMTISGPLDKPVSSYKVMGAVTGTLGNIVNSMLNLMTNTITTPFRLFSGGR